MDNGGATTTMQETKGGRTILVQRTGVLAGGCCAWQENIRMNGQAVLTALNGGGLTN